MSTLHSNVLPLDLIPVSSSSPGIPYVKVTHSTNHQGSPNSRKNCRFELLFIEKSEGWYRINERKVWAVPGDLFLIAPGEVCNFISLEGLKSWRVTFEADAPTLSQTNDEVLLTLTNQLLMLSFMRLNRLEGQQLRVAPEDRPRWVARLQQLERELCDKQLGFAETVRMLLALLLIDTFRLAAKQLDKPSLQFHPLVTSVFQFIEKYYQDQIGLCDVAEAVSRSPAYLTDFVRRETGRTVLNWIIGRRLAEARRLLLTTNQSVERVAEAVGYLDTGHFIRQFRRLHGGITPRAWSNANRS